MDEVFKAACQAYGASTNTVVCAAESHRAQAACSADRLVRPLNPEHDLAPSIILLEPSETNSHDVTTAQNASFCIIFVID